MHEIVALGLDHDGVRLLQLSLLLAIGTVVEKDKDSPEMKNCVESLERYFETLGPEGVHSLAQALTNHFTSTRKR